MRLSTHQTFCYGEPDTLRGSLLPGTPQRRIPSTLEATLDDQERVFRDAFAILREAINERALPAASLAVTHHGKLVALKAMGRFTYEPNASEVTPDSIFDLASVSKVVATTTAAMILYQRGQLDLGMPAAAILPAFAGTDSLRQQVTVGMLLAHISGLPAYVRLYEKARTREELVTAACQTPLLNPPGERTEYSDIGFIVLGEALARIADEPLDSFCRREVFGPLAMANTSFNPPPKVRPQIPPTEDDRGFRRRVIQGEVHDENAWVMAGVAGHAGVFAPAVDVALFATAMLGGGLRIVRPQTLDFFTRRLPAAAGNPRALGWDVPTPPSQSGRYLSARSFGHLGYTGTSLWIDPERSLSITLLTNRTWPDRRSQAIKTARPRFHDAVMEALRLC